MILSGNTNTSGDSGITSPVILAESLTFHCGRGLPPVSKAVSGVVAPPPGSKAAAGIAKESTAPHPHFQEQGMSGSRDRGAATVACIHVNNLSADWGCMHGAVQVGN